MRGGNGRGEDSRTKFCLTQNQPPSQIHHTKADPCVYHLLNESGCHCPTIQLQLDRNADWFYIRVGRQFVGRRSLWRRGKWVKGYGLQRRLRGNVLSNAGMGKEYLPTCGGNWGGSGTGGHSSSLPLANSSDSSVCRSSAVGKVKSVFACVRDKSFYSHPAYSRLAAIDTPCHYTSTQTANLLSDRSSSLKVAESLGRKCDQILRHNYVVGENAEVYALIEGSYTKKCQ